MDEIRISDLVVFANHGVFQEEAVLGQKFLVSAVIETDIRKPGRSDSLDNTINYGEVSQEITRFLTENRFQLIEACAEQLAEYLLLKYETLMKRITLEIKKPWAPVRLPLDTVSVKITRGWHTVYIALGSNMGDKDAYLEFGVEELKKLPQIRIDQVSSFIRTEPYGYTDQDVFLNGACKVRTTFTPEELLDEMQRIELEAKRVRKIHWGPRTLDLDLLFYDQEIIATERLNVPHPDMANRDFVLKPMAELSPWWGHPVTHKTMAQMLAELEQRSADK
ncbi:MAG: 2-amino-4-hydroxy-6-hydroxymethyldihydropteridine diphosphokinase [Lachnospiraceae bacterium]|nr:2-amino-4-hydroxy-6-hydroxymethyldihydropteridine diphosphokinase [Lachnospiraceae bacterium]